MCSHRIHQIPLNRKTPFCWSYIWNLEEKRFSGTALMSLAIIYVLKNVSLSLSISLNWWLFSSLYLTPIFKISRLWCGWSKVECVCPCCRKKKEQKIWSSSTGGKGQLRTTHAVLRIQRKIRNYHKALCFLLPRPILFFSWISLPHFSSFPLSILNTENYLIYSVISK